MKDTFTLFLATGGWIGFSPVAPGTFGSLAAIPLCWLLSLVEVEVALVILILFIVLASIVAHHAEIAAAQKDPKQIVVDEICGMAVTLIGMPFTPVVVIGGFALFRLFDIGKPFPIRWVEGTLPGGLGVVADDLLAGLFAHLFLRVGLVWFFGAS